LLPANLVPTTPSIEFMVTPDQHTFGAWSGLANVPGGAKQHLMWIDHDARSGVPRLADSGSIENVFNDPRSVHVAATMSAKFVALSCVKDGKPTIGGLRIRPGQGDAFVIDPTAGPFGAPENRAEPAVVGTSLGAVYAWQAGAAGAEDIMFVLIPND
jgi:hypothetical protein